MAYSKNATTYKPASKSYKTYKAPKRSYKTFSAPRNVPGKVYKAPARKTPVKPNAIGHITTPIPHRTSYTKTVAPPTSAVVKKNPAAVGGAKNFVPSRSYGVQTGGASASYIVLKQPGQADIAPPDTSSFLPEGVVSPRGLDVDRGDQSFDGADPTESIYSRFADSTLVIDLPYKPTGVPWGGGGGGSAASYAADAYGSTGSGDYVTEDGGGGLLDFDDSLRERLVSLGEAMGDSMSNMMIALIALAVLALIILGGKKKK